MPRFPMMSGVGMSSGADTSPAANVLAIAVEVTIDFPINTSR